MLTYNDRAIIYNEHIIDESVKLPPFTMRLRYIQGHTPVEDSWRGSLTCVDADKNIWDYNRNDTSWADGYSYIPDVRYVAEVLGANTTGVRHMYGLFSGASNLEKVAIFDTSTVTETGHMFDGCKKLKYCPAFNLTNVRDSNYMFAQCDNLERVDVYNISAIKPESELKVALYMFWRCPKLKSVAYLDFSKATDVRALFEYDTELETIGHYDFSSVIEGDYAFYQCHKLRTFNDISCPNAERLSYMYYQNYAMTTLPKVLSISNTAFNGTATLIEGIYKECVNVSNGILDQYNIFKDYNFAYSGLHNQTFTDTGINTTTGAAELAQIPDDWK